MEIKRLKDEIEIDMDRRTHLLPKYKPSKDKNDYQPNITNNINIMKSL